MIKQKDLKTILIEFKLKCIHFIFKIPENKREILIKIAKTKAIFYQMISQNKAKQSKAKQSKAKYSDRGNGDFKKILFLFILILYYGNALA